VAEIQKLSFYNKRTPHFDTRPVITLPHVLAEAYVQAAIFVASMLGKYTKKPPKLLTDSVAVPSTKSSFVSFGLYSNDMTWLYLNTDPDPMFAIGDDPNGKRYLVHLGDGQNKIYGGDEKSDHAIIMKFRPQPQLEPDRIWIICAGLGVSGTIAAAWHFVNVWREYQKRFGRNDFVIILRVSNSLAAYESAVEVAASVRRKSK
jgi:hypothetical protein